MGNHSVLLQQPVWVTPGGLRRGLRAGGRPEETKKPTVREEQQAPRVRPSSGGGVGSGAGLAAQSSSGREAELRSWCRAFKGNSGAVAGFRPPALPQWKVPHTGSFHLPCLMSHGKRAPFCQKWPSQPLLTHRAHPNCSRTHIEKTGQGTQRQDTQGVFPAVPALPPDVPPMPGVRLGRRRPGHGVSSTAPLLPYLHTAGPRWVWFLHLYLPPLTSTFPSCWGS